MGPIKKVLLGAAIAIGLGAIFMPKEGKDKIKNKTKDVGKGAAKIVGEATSEAIQEEAKKKKK